MEDIVVPIFLFASIALIVGLTVFYRFRAKQELLSTVRQAMDHGQTLEASMLTELVASLQPKPNDLRRGAIFIALGCAFVVTGVGLTDATDDGSNALVAISAFPFFLGTAYLGLWFLQRKS